MRLVLILLVLFSFLICHEFIIHPVSFEVRPNIFSACEQPSNISELKWAVSKEGVTSTAIYVRRMGEPETLWGPGELTGTLRTGAWVSDGLTFILRDQNQNFLARRTIVTTRCVGAEFGE